MLWFETLALVFPLTLPFVLVILSAALLEASMARSRVLDGLATARTGVALLLSYTLLITPLCAAPSAPLGTVIFADGAHVGTASASVGTTIFPGDRISADQKGNMQVRFSAARLVLVGESIAMLAQEESTPAATLTLGEATFSTANSKAFVLHVASAVIRPSTDQPTIGRVIVLGPEELIVKSVRGALLIAVEDDVREIPEGMAYRVVLDPNAPAAYPQGPRGAGTKGMGRPPLKAAKSKFIWYAIAITTGVTIWVAHEVFESSDDP
jgi:hypothetical protein